MKFGYSFIREINFTADKLTSSISDIETRPAEPKFYDAPSVTLTCVLKSKGLTVSDVKWVKDGAPVVEPAYTVTSESDSLTTRLQINEVGTLIFYLIAAFSCLIFLICICNRVLFTALVNKLSISHSYNVLQDKNWQVEKSVTF